MSKVTVHGIYDDDEQLKNGAIKIVGMGLHVKEVFSPFPVHGIDPIIGVKRTLLPITSFIYGCTGALLATWMMWYMMISDWPTEIGGKPNFTYLVNWPAFIPITFESTVLCAAHGMAITFFIRSWLMPGVTPKNPDLRTTDNKFLMLLEVNQDDLGRVQSALKETGASEVNVQ